VNEVEARSILKVCEHRDEERRRDQPDYAGLAAFYYNTMTYYEFAARCEISGLVEGRYQIDDNALQVAKVDFCHSPRLGANTNGIGKSVRPAFQVAP